MIGLDTNVLARYYVESDDAPTRKQSQLARNLIDSGQPLIVVWGWTSRMHTTTQATFLANPSQVATIKNLPDAQRLWVSNQT
jgi:hypothetical protein